MAYEKTDVGGLRAGAVIGTGGGPPPRNMAAEQPSRQSHVQQAFEHIAKLGQYLNERTGMLEDRLGPILRMAPPTDVANKAESVGVGLADALQEAARILEISASRVDSILSRLEL